MAFANLLASTSVSSSGAGAAVDFGGNTDTWDFQASISNFSGLTSVQILVEGSSDQGRWNAIVDFGAQAGNMAAATKSFVLGSVPYCRFLRARWVVAGTGSATIAVGDESINASYDAEQDPTQD